MLVAWTVAPSASHAPKLPQPAEHLTETAADHGHSHGLEEDLFQALHGHDHDVADHDHSQAALPMRMVLNRAGPLAPWPGYVATHRTPPDYRLRRPPRA
jgi:hypothetical protein